MDESDMNELARRGRSSYGAPPVPIPGAGIVSRQLEASSALELANPFRNSYRIALDYIRYSRIANNMLKPQDVLVLLKLTTLWPEPWTYASLAESLGMSASEVHAAIRRSTQAGLFSESARTAIQPELGAFLINGVPYVFYAEQGGITKRGLLTGFAAPVLDGPDSVPPSALNVWPDASGTDSGRIIQPLYRSAPYAAKQDPLLYRLLGLVDELRIGRARERNRAAAIIREALC